MCEKALPVLYMSHGGGVLINKKLPTFAYYNLCRTSLWFLFIGGIGKSPLVWIITSQTPQAVVVTVLLPLLSHCRVGIFMPTNFGFF